MSTHKRSCLNIKVVLWSPCALDGACTHKCTRACSHACVHTDRNRAEEMALWIKYCHSGMRNRVLDPHENQEGIPSLKRQKQGTQSQRWQVHILWDHSVLINKLESNYRHQLQTTTHTSTPPCTYMCSHTHANMLTYTHANMHMKKVIIKAIEDGVFSLQLTPFYNFLAGMNILPHFLYMVKKSYL